MVLISPYFHADPTADDLVIEPKTGDVVTQEEYATRRKIIQAYERALATARASTEAENGRLGGLDDKRTSL